MWPDSRDSSLDGRKVKEFGVHGLEPPQVPIGFALLGPN